MLEANNVFILPYIPKTLISVFHHPFPNHTSLIQEIYPHLLRLLFILLFFPQGRICKIAVAVGAGDMWRNGRLPPAVGGAPRRPPIPAVNAAFFIPRRLGITAG